MCLRVFFFKSIERWFSTSKKRHVMEKYKSLNVLKKLHLCKSSNEEREVEYFHKFHHFISQLIEVCQKKKNLLSEAFLEDEK